MKTTQKDGKIYHVFVLEGSYFQNDYTTQGDLQIQCNPYQSMNDIFHRTRTDNLKTCMKKQKIQNLKKKILKKTTELENQVS